MLPITVVTVGDFPKGPFSELGMKFSERLKHVAKLSSKAVTDGPADKLLSHVGKNDTLVVLEATGKAMTSESFATFLEGHLNIGKPVTFLIGGPKGLPDEVKQRADHLLSLSAMTTTHDMAHLFLLEQLYRAFSIIRGSEYHY